MALTELCSPAIIYLVFSLVQIIIDTFKGEYNTAFMKSWVTLLFTILLNYLCERGLNVVSWIIVFIPFVLTTIVISVLLFVFGLNPTTGKVITHDLSKKPTSSYVDARVEAARQDVNHVTSKKTSPVSKTAAPVESSTKPDVVIHKKEKITITEKEE